MQHFGEKLRSLRMRQEMTLVQLAQALGYAAHGRISELEAGKKVPTAEFVLKVSDFFNVTTDQLLKDGLEVDLPISATMRTQASPLAFTDREPTAGEVEKLRLILSTYQDGTGMLAIKNAVTLPGWRDFERAVAITFDGVASESKALFDVVFQSPKQAEVHYGISCKMRRELNRIKRDNRVTIEVSNSAGKFWDQLAIQNLNTSNYRRKPVETGVALINLIESWYNSLSSSQGGIFDIPKSCYLVLSWSVAGDYQLHQFPLTLPDPNLLAWDFPVSQRTGQSTPGRRLCGHDAAGTIIEWYGESGGQLKYYPLESSALWKSEVFRLEPLPDLEYGVQAKAQTYFRRQWKAACKQHEADVKSSTHS